MAKQKYWDGSKWVQVAPSMEEFDAHKAEKVHQEEVHGMRITDDKFEFFNGTEWIVVKGGVPVGNVANFTAEEGSAEVTLFWSDPEDRYLDSEPLAIWKGTKIIRKTSTYPTSEDDGVMVVDNKNRNQYATNGYRDTGLTNDVEYYYMAFPYTEDDAPTIDGANRVSAKPSAAPGPSTLIGGNMQAGFYGEVPASQLINGTDLASLIGLSAGTAQHTNESWLKFAYEGKIQYVAKKTYRNGLSWNQLNAAGVVHGKVVTIDGKQYRVRLMRGAENDPSHYSDADRDAIGSEWNKLMLPIHENAPSSWADPQYGGTTEDWGINYTDADLLTHNTDGNGSNSWMQEVRGGYSAWRVIRGGRGVSSSNSSAASTTNSRNGWRPCLELVK